MSVECGSSVTNCDVHIGGGGEARVEASPKETVEEDGGWVESSGSERVVEDLGAALGGAVVEDGEPAPTVKSSLWA